MWKPKEPCFTLALVVTLFKNSRWVGFMVRYRQRWKNWKAEVQTHRNSASRPFWVTIRLNVLFCTIQESLVIFGHMHWIHILSLIFIGLKIRLNLLRYWILIGFGYWKRLFPLAFLGICKSLKFRLPCLTLVVILIACLIHLLLHADSAALPRCLE